jgi:phosphatidylglycerol:prolipoprotein diacylglycerol transferase
MIFYGLFRVLTEQFREPDIQVGYLFGLFSMGTLLSMCMVLIGLFIFFKVKNNEFSK